jgi:hypothetical protein
MRALTLRLLRCIAALAVAGSIPTASPAASFERKDLRAVAAEAETIVVGWVLEQQALRLPSGLIVTEFVVAVDERIKGAGTQATERVTMAGGTVGNESQQIVGFPTLVAGARYVLFIGRQRVALVPFVGGHQGMYRVNRDPDTNEDFVAESGEAPVPGGQPGNVAEQAQALTRAPNPRARLGLGEFKAQIRRALAP